MDIKKLFDSLTENEKSVFYTLLKSEKTKYSEELHVVDWIKIVGASHRLYNIICSNYPKDKGFITPNDITYNDFMLIRGAGDKCWSEFTILRGY